MMRNPLLLAADMGGTKTDLAIYSRAGGPRAPLARSTVHSADYPSLQALLAAFIATVKRPIDRACIAVCGPVVNGRSRITNLPWELDEKSLAQELHISSVHLLNDLEATAAAVPLLSDSELRTLNAGWPEPNGAVGVLAPGTGLGEAFLTRDGSQYVTHCSEGGHADFAPTDEEQIGLLRYCLERSDHVSVEHVCSGIGIPRIHAYLRDAGHSADTPAVAQAIAAAPDPSVVIIANGVDPHSRSPLCAATMEMFASILASEAANLALKVFATGGIYMAGGIPVHALSALQAPRFLESFTRKGRFRQAMARLPVHVVTTHAALLGAAAHGLGTIPGASS